MTPLEAMEDSARPFGWPGTTAHKVARDRTTPKAMGIADSGNCEAKQLLCVTTGALGSEGKQQTSAPLMPGKAAPLVARESSAPVNEGWRRPWWRKKPNQTHRYPMPVTNPRHNSKE